MAEETNQLLRFGHGHVTGSVLGAGEAEVTDTASLTRSTHSLGAGPTYSRCPRSAPEGTLVQSVRRPPRARDRVYNQESGIKKLHLEALLGRNSGKNISSPEKRRFNKVCVDVLQAQPGDRAVPAV